MKYIDADGHVEECPTTFSDQYLEPAFRPQRPSVIGRDGLAYWVIDEQMFPRRVGRGCNNLGTPASYDGIPTRHTALKPDSIESMELTDISARLRSMDAEDIAIQVVYPSLFLAYPLTSNTAFATALYSSYNRWLGDGRSGRPEPRLFILAECRTSLAPGTHSPIPFDLCVVQTHITPAPGTTRARSLLDDLNPSFTNNRSNFCTIAMPYQ